MARYGLTAGCHVNVCVRKAIYVSGQIKCYTSLPISLYMSFSQRHSPKKINKHISQVGIYLTKENSVKFYTADIFSLYIMVIYQDDKRKQFTKRNRNKCSDCRTYFDCILIIRH